MGRNIKILIGIFVIAIVVAGTVFGVKTYGAMSAESAKEKADSVAVAQVNGVNITKGEFELAKKNVVKNKLNLTEKEVLFKLIVNEVMVQEAKKNGFTISEEKVKQIMEAQRGKVKKDDSEKFETYLKEVGMSERAYWKDQAKKIRSTNLRNQYREHLKTEFAKKNQIKDTNSIEAKFADFYEEVTSEVMSVADIKILIKV